MNLSLSLRLTKRLPGRRQQNHWREKWQQFGNAFPVVLRGQWQSGLTGHRSVFIQQNRLTTAGNTLLWSTAFHILTVNSYCSQNWRDFELDQTLHKMLALCFTVSYRVAVHCSPHQISCYSAALHVACVGV